MLPFEFAEFKLMKIIREIFKLWDSKTGKNADFYQGELKMDDMLAKAGLGEITGTVKLVRDSDLLSSVPKSYHSKFPKAGLVNHDGHTTVIQNAFIMYKNKP
jgi:hypothetical protein